MNVVSDCLLTEALLIGHRSCIGSVYSTYGLRERTNCGRGCSFSFFSCRNYYRDKEALRQMKQKKTCGKNQHVRIDNIYRKANLICCRTDDAVEINLRYYILGAQVREDGPSVVLRYRLDAAIEYLNENPNTICIVSGGQGFNEPFSEADGMADYLIENGIEKSRILLEDESTNTLENIRNSKALMESSYNGVGIVTNNFHVFRAVQLAKAQGLENVCGIAADSSKIYLPNNVLRECCGILKDWLLNNI